MKPRNALLLVPFALASCQLGARLGVPAPRVSSVPPPSSAPAPAGYSNPGPANNAGAGCQQEFGNDAGELFDQAVPVAPDTVVTGCVAMDVDDKADTYVIDLPSAAHSYLIRINAVPVGTNDNYLTLKLFDVEREKLNVSLPDPWGVFPGGSRAFVRLGTDDIDDNAYQWSYTVTPIGDADEPNDSFEQATSIELGTAKEGYWIPVRGQKYDEVRDVYRFQVKKPGELSFAITDLGEDFALDAIIYDSDRQRIGHESSSNAGANVRGSTRVKAGTYYLVLEHSYPSANPYGKKDLPSRFTKPYRLQVSMK